MAASVSQIKHKRQRENITDCYSGEYEDDQNLQKRSRDDLLSDLFSRDDAEGGAVEDDLVLQVIKNLQEEINGTPEILPVSGGNNQMGKTSRITDEAGEWLSSYEYLVNATDDQLGISPSPPLSVEENDNQGISNKFCSDLFESPQVLQAKAWTCSASFFRIAIRIITEIMWNTTRFLFLRISKSGYKRLSRIWPYRGF